MAFLCVMTQEWGSSQLMVLSSQAAQDLVTSPLEGAAGGSKGSGEVGTLLEQLEK